MMQTVVGGNHFIFIITGLGQCNHRRRNGFEEAWQGKLGGVGSGAKPQKNFKKMFACRWHISCKYVPITFLVNLLFVSQFISLQLTSLSTVIDKFAVGTGLDRLVPKLKLQKLNFWLNFDKKVAQQLPMVAVPLLKVALHLPCHVHWWRHLWMQCILHF